MGAFVEQREGYGWTSGGTAAVASNSNGLYYESFDTSSDNFIQKTIYVDAQAGSPVYISKPFRVYNIDIGATSDFKVTTGGLLADLSANSMNLVDAVFTCTQATNAVTGQGYKDFTIEGWAISDVTVKIHTADANCVFYPMNESGY